MGEILEGQWLRADLFQNLAMEGSLEKSIINTPETILASIWRQMWLIRRVRSLGWSRSSRLIFLRG